MSILQSQFGRALGIAFFLSMALNGPVISQEDASEEEAVEGEVTETPDYFDEDLFGIEESIEESREEGDEDQSESENDASDIDFFDQLEIAPTDGNESEIDARSIAGEDIESLPSIGYRQTIDNRDYASYWDTAVFQALDKVTARIKIIEAPLETPVFYERFEITVRQCNKRPPEETPNTTAFVEVDELTPTGERQDIFTGWMFASSPGLNAVEHPVYDVWLIDCKRVAPVTTDIIPELKDAFGEEGPAAEAAGNQSDPAIENATELPSVE